MLGKDLRGAYPKKWMIQAQLMPSRRPINTAFTQPNKSKSIQGSIYLEDNDAHCQAQSNIKFELIGTSVSKHNDSINQHRASANNSKTRAYPDQRRQQRVNISKETNTSNMLIANDLGQVLHSSTANMTDGVPRSPLDR